MISISYFKVIVHCCFILILIRVQLALSIVRSIFLFNLSPKRLCLSTIYDRFLLVIMRQWMAGIWMIMRSSNDSFDFSAAIVPPGTSNGSNGNPASQSSTPLASNRGANGWKDEIAKLNLGQGLRASSRGGKV